MTKKTLSWCTMVGIVFTILHLNAAAPADVRVAPFLGAKWGQETSSHVTGRGEKCYNYYTPNNYPCGCVATALAELMRYHCWPQQELTAASFPCKVDDLARQLPLMTGTFDWANMPLVPEDEVELREEQCQAIGKLTYNASVALRTWYAPMDETGLGGSSASGYYASWVLTDVFGYGSALAAVSDAGLSLDVLKRVIIPNLDARQPVIATIRGTSGNHVIVADGYGYDGSDWYVHFSMGWAGTDDGWYCMPKVNPSGMSFNLFHSVVFNVRPRGDNGETLISGRVCDTALTTVAGEQVFAQRVGGEAYQTLTDANGIWALSLPVGTYAISVGGVTRTVEVKANVGTEVTQASEFVASPAPVVNNQYGIDFTITKEIPSYVVTFDLGDHGKRTGGGELSQSVKRGKAAVLPTVEAGEGWKFMGWQGEWTDVTGDVTITALYEAIPDGLRAGEWTDDTEAALMAPDCRLVLVLTTSTNYADQVAQKLLWSEKFLSWAATHGVYLVNVGELEFKTKDFADLRLAEQFFWTLFLSETGVKHQQKYVFYPTIMAVRPTDYTYDEQYGYQYVPCGYDVLREGKRASSPSNDNYDPDYATEPYYQVGSRAYDAKLDTLIAGLSEYLPTITSTITFDANGGTGGPAAVTAADGSLPPSLTGASAVVPTQEGYVFTGYYDAVSGGVQYYDSALQPCCLWDKTAEAVTLYAQWQKVTHLYFNAQGGTWTLGTVDVVYGAQLPALTEIPTKDGFVFLGWFDAAEGGTQYYDAQGRALHTWDGKTANAVLYAQWQTWVPGIGFEETEVALSDSAEIKIVVKGGSVNNASSVKLYLTYETLKAADLDLKSVTLDGKVLSAVKFPLTLSWDRGDIADKTLVLPLKALKAVALDRYLTLQLAGAVGQELLEANLCTVVLVGKGGSAVEPTYVRALLEDPSTGGKVSGSASVSGGKAVTLKATAGKGYWFAGWFDEEGALASADVSFKYVPVSGRAIETYRACFVPAHAEYAGTYNGFARMNLDGMNVKGGRVGQKVLADYAFTLAVTTAGKVSGAINVGGKKLSFKSETCCQVSDSEAVFLAALDEKAVFGTAVTERLYLHVAANGAVTGEAISLVGSYAPLVGEEVGIAAGKDFSKDAVRVAKLSAFAGSYTLAMTNELGYLVAASVTVDAKGKVKLAGRCFDATTISASGVLGDWQRDADTLLETASCDLLVLPKSFGAGSCHVVLQFERATDAKVVRVASACHAVKWTDSTPVAYVLEGVPFGAFASACWFPQDMDPSASVLSVKVEDLTLAIPVLVKASSVSGLDKPLESGWSVKLDAKTGILEVKKGKELTLFGVLTANGCFLSGVWADGAIVPASASFETLDIVESFPWLEETVRAGEAYSCKPFVCVNGSYVALTFSGLPSGLKYDKKTLLLSGTAKKAGTFTVKIAYALGSVKKTLVKPFVVE